MGEAFLSLIACVVFLAVLASPVAVVLAVRSNRRLRELEGKVRGLEKTLREGQRPSAPEPPAAAPPEPKPVVPEPRATPPPPAPEPVPATDPRAPAEEPDLFTPLYTEQEPAKKKAATARPASGPTGLERLRQRLSGVDWERWIGVRGMAVVAGVALAMAAIMLFRHAFTQGWINPKARVFSGTLTGLACLVGGALLRKRRYKFAPDALQGAGLVALYATIYAADKRYHFLSLAASFPLMAVVTAAACVLAVRHGSRLIAILGLVGGFATPLLLSTGSDRPLPLFGYVLLLDLGLFFVGRKRGWASIGFLALLGTFLVETLWIFGRMGPERIPLGIGFVALFAALFALAGHGLSATERKRWFPAQAGGVLFPFVFALYFANQLELSGHVWPNALLLGLLCAAGCYLGRAQAAPWLAHGAATAGMAVVAVWYLDTPVDAAVAWELSLVALGLALIPHAFAEWERRRGETTTLPSASLAAVAWLLLLLIGCPRAEHVMLLAPLVGLVGVAALAVRQAWLSERGLLVLGAAAATGLGVALHYDWRRATADLPPPLIAGIQLVLALVLLGLAIRARSGPRRATLHAVGLFVVPVVLALAERRMVAPYDAWLPPLIGLALVVVLLIAATRLNSSVWYGVAALLAVIIDTAWTDDYLSGARSSGALVLAFLGVLASALLVVSWPTLRQAEFRERRLAYAASAFALVVWLLPVTELYLQRFGAALDMAPPFLLALIGLANLAWLSRRAAAAAPVARAWIGSATGFLLALGISLQIGREEGVLTIALWCVALAWLAGWIPQRAPGWLAAILAVGAACIVGGNALDPFHYWRSEAVLLNELTLVHLLPAACLFATAALLRRVDPGRAGKWPLVLFRGGPGLALVVVVFAWINLLILNFFGEQQKLSFALERLPQRDLTTSLAWGVYALVLLGLGTWKRTMALRWTSLALLLLAIGKVFLHDLAHLEGLYRVGSLAGLAFSLFVVSLFYQRFVFRRGATEAELPHA